MPSSESPYNPSQRHEPPSPYRDLARLRQQMREEVQGLREEILENRTTIEELKERLTRDEA